MNSVVISQRIVCLAERPIIVSQYSNVLFFIRLRVVMLQSATVHLCSLRLRKRCSSFSPANVYVNSHFFRRNFMLVETALSKPPNPKFCIYNTANFRGALPWLKHKFNNILNLFLKFCCKFSLSKHKQRRRFCLGIILWFVLYSEWLDFSLTSNGGRLQFDQLHTVLT